ncbi:MAG TPA: tetratricopeptide repeat protein, partial [Bryobacteraceae bacterium]|nr:tetratricopeptide repeat protein [Bryobacteraceae bacterium]
RQRPEDVDTLYNLAAAEILLKQEGSAVRHLALAARAAPERADVQLLMARTTFRMGFRADALLAFDRYLQLVPGDEHARRERAFTAALTGRQEESVPELEGYAKRHPGDATGHYQLAVALSAADVERALAEFDRALEIDPGLVAARYGRGVLNYRRAKADAALADLEFAAEKQPGNAKVLDRLGQTYMALERPADAVRVLRSAQELEPGNSTVLLHLGRALANAGRADEAKAAIERFRRAGPSRDDIRKPAGLIEFMSRTPAEQQAEYRARVEHDIATNPKDAATQVRYIKLLLDEGRNPEAAAQARALAAHNPPPALLAKAGRNLLDAEQYQPAQELLEAAALAGSSPEIELDAAIAVFHAVSPQAGLERMERVPVPQRGGDYYLARAQMLDAAGQFEPAVEALNRALHAAPKRPELYREATLFLIKNNRLDAALNLLDEAARLLPENPEILLNKATTLELARKTEEAQRLLDEIQNRWPEWYPGWLAHGIVLDTHKRYDEARQMLEVAVTLGARGPEAYFYLADATLRTSPERIDAAEKAVSQALALTPSDPWALALAGRIAFERKQYDRAIELLRESLRLRPGMAQAHYHLAQAYSAVGRKEEAQTELGELRSIREKYPMADEAPADVLGTIFRVKPPRE